MVILLSAILFSILYPNQAMSCQPVLYEVPKYWQMHISFRTLAVHLIKKHKCLTSCKNGGVARM